MLHVLIGTVCVIFIWKSFQKWRQDRWVKRTLEVGAGLDQIKTHGRPTSESRSSPAPGSKDF